jgi:hypothetical protein
MYKQAEAEQNNAKPRDCGYDIFQCGSFGKGVLKANLRHFPALQISLQANDMRLMFDQPTKLWKSAFL